MAKVTTEKRGGIVLVTNNSDLTTALTFQTKPNTSYDIEVRGVYQRVGSNQASSYWRRGLFRTNAAGVVTQVGDIQTPAADLEDAAGAQFVLSISGTTLRVQVAAEGSPVNWTVDHYLRIADAVAQA